MNVAAGNGFTAVGFGQQIVIAVVDVVVRDPGVIHSQTIVVGIVEIGFATLGGEPMSGVEGIGLTGLVGQLAFLVIDETIDGGATGIPFGRGMGKDSI